MLLNIGNEAIDAARSLHQHDNTREIFQKLRDGLLEVARKEMNRALECVDHNRLDEMVGYSRALRDIYMALESAATGKPINQVEKPGPEARRAAR